MEQWSLGLISPQEVQKQSEKSCKDFRNAGCQAPEDLAKMASLGGSGNSPQNMSRDLFHFAEPRTIIAKSFMCHLPFKDGKRHAQALLLPEVLLPGVLGCPEVGQLYKILFRCCQNGVISKSKLKSALWATQNEFSRMNLQPKHDSDYMDALDERIRVLASHFRDLKRCEEKYCRLMRKATEQEKKEVDEVLAELKLEVEQPAEPSRPASSSSCVALVPYVAHEKKADAVQSQEEKALRIFQRVLSRQEASPEKLPVVKVVSSGQRQLQQRISDASEESLTFLHEALGDAEEKSKVKKAKRSSGVQKLRAEACQRSMDLSEEEVAFLQNAFEEKVDISKKVKKRPASAAAPQKKRKTEETKKRVPKQKAAVSVQSSPMKKSSKRRRVRDSAYHKAKRLARINGFSPGSACRKASEAAAKAAKAFDEAH